MLPSDGKDRENTGMAKVCSMVCGRSFISSVRACNGKGISCRGTVHEVSRLVAQGRRVLGARGSVKEVNYGPVDPSF